MRTNNPMRLHCKCVKIIEMIRQNQDRIDREKARLLQFDNCRDPYAPIRLMNNRDDIKDNIYRLQCVDERLVQYYNNTFMKLIQWMHRETKTVA